MANTFLLIVILIVLVVLYFLFNNYRKTMGDPHHDEHHHDGGDGVCCGRHTVCDKGYDNSSLYFDDEELDRFKDREQESYSDEEVEEFRTVLYTMKEEEVDQWVKCLAARHIELPSQLKDEIFLMLQQ